jgi:hypothetical protein
MASPKTETAPTVASKSERSGILPSVVFLALDVAERGQATAIAVLQDARGELRGAADHGVELAEKLAAAVLRFARKGIQRVDEASAEALDGAGRVLGGAVRSARETTRAAAELATTATTGLTGAAPGQPGSGSVATA